MRLLGRRVAVLLAFGASGVGLGVARAEDAPTPPPRPPAERPPAWARVSPSQIAEAERLGVPVAFEDPTTTIRFVLVPGGKSTIGSPATEPGRVPSEGPQVEVTLSPFYLATEETTNGQYRRLVLDHRGGQFVPSAGNGRGGPLPLDGDRQPVVNVTALEVARFVDRLNQFDAPMRDTARFRLPSEAEWEHACRAGSTTSTPWGDDVSEGPRHANIADPLTRDLFGLTVTGWNADDGFRVTAPVASFPPNAFGLYDMIGNVAEWCADFFDDGEYARLGAGSPSDRVDPVGPSGGTHFVIRGAGFLSAATSARSARRAAMPVVPLASIPGDGKGADLGFRLASTLPATRAIAGTSRESVHPLIGLDAPFPPSWVLVERYGVSVGLARGGIRFRGTAVATDDARAPTFGCSSHTVFELDTFHEVSARVRARDGATVGLGIGSARELDEGRRIVRSVSVFARSGRVAVRVGGGADPTFRDGEIHDVTRDGAAIAWPTDQWMTIRIVRQGDVDGSIAVHLGDDERPVFVDRVRSLKAGRGQLGLWIGGWANAGAPVDAEVADLRAIREKK